MSFGVFECAGFTTQDRASLRSIHELLAHSLKGQQQIMAALDDIKAAIARLGTDITAEMNAFTQAMTKAQQANSDGSISAADAEKLVDQLNGLSTDVEAKTAALSGAVPTPAPGPAPTSGPTATPTTAGT